MKKYFPPILMTQQETELDLPEPNITFGELRKKASVNWLKKQQFPLFITEGRGRMKRVVLVLLDPMAYRMGEVFLYSIIKSVEKVIKNPKGEESL